MVELKDMLRTDQVLEAVLAQVAQRGLGRQLIADQVGGGCGQEGLTSVSHGHQARSPVQRRTVVVAAALLGLAGVKSHPDPKAMRVDLLPAGFDNGLLRLQRSANAGLSRFEDGVKPISGGLDDAAAIVLDGAAQQLIVARQSRLHLPGEFLPEFGAAFEISEQEGYGARGEVRCHAGTNKLEPEDTRGYLTCRSASITGRPGGDVTNAKRRHRHERP